MAKSSVSIIGAGTMGSGIAQVFAQSEFDVSLIDVDASYLDRAAGATDTTIGANAGPCAGSAPSVIH